MARIGDRRHKMWVQSKTQTRDDYGSITETWENDTEVFAGLWPVKGTEYHLARQSKEAITHKILMKWTTLKDGTRVTRKNRISYEDRKLSIDRIFNIESVINPDERSIDLILMCIEDV